MTAAAVQICTNGRGLMSVREAARLLKVSIRGLYLAHEVARYGCPELEAAVWNGEVRTGPAAFATRFPKDVTLAALELLRKWKAEKVRRPTLRAALQAVLADEEDRCEPASHCIGDAELLRRIRYHERKLTALLDIAYARGLESEQEAAS